MVRVNYKISKDGLLEVLACRKLWDSTNRKPVKWVKGSFRKIDPGVPD